MVSTKEIGGNHAFFRDNKASIWKKSPCIAFYFTALRIIGVYLSLKNAWQCYVLHFILAYQRKFASKGEGLNSKVQQRHKVIFIQLVYCIVLLPTTTSANSECGAYLLAVSKNAHHLLVQLNTFLQYFLSVSHSDFLLTSNRSVLIDQLTDNFFSVIYQLTVLILQYEKLYLQTAAVHEFLY